MIKTKLTGYFSSILYCLITAYSIVLIHQLAQDIDPVLSILFTFIFSAIIFNLLSAPHIKQTYLKAWQNRGLILKLNASTALCWLTIFVSLKYLDPAFANALFMVVTPLITYLLHLLKKHKHLSRKKIFLGLLLIFVCIIMFGENLENTIHTHHFFTGVILLLLSCLGGAAYLLYTQDLHEAAEFSSIEILSTRFYLLIIFAFIISCSQHTISQFIFLPVIKLILLAFVTSIIPLFCLQFAIKRIGAVQFSLLTPSTIIMAYFIDAYFVPESSITAIGFVLICLLTLLLFLYNMVD